jgi:hypothetical protein
MYNPVQSRLISTAVTRLQRELAQAAPVMAEQVVLWTRQLSGSGQPEDYFKHPLAFPSLLLPWWLEDTLADTPDLGLQADLIFSTINGYYHIRLIDNLIDNHATVELSLLPALGFFHTQFQGVYQHYFASDHSFWDFFCRVWFHSGEVALKDAGLTDIAETQFEQIAAQKVGAVKIPLAAVCYRYDRPDLIDPWSHFVDLLGCWHQMLNDLLGWHRDHSRQTATYFLSQAERRRNEDEPVVEWVAREGFAWAVDKLEEWMFTLQLLASELGSGDLAAYLDTRQRMLLKQKDEVAAGLRTLNKIVLAGSSRKKE